MARISYQNPVHLAVMIEGRLEKDRPNVRLVPTSNPGEDTEHYICLALRVYERDPNKPNDIGRFVGYVTFRMNEVRRQRKTEFLPKFSSVECRNEDFGAFANGKVHFAAEKVSHDDFAAYQAADNAVPAGTPNEERESVRGEILGKKRFETAYQTILAMVDGTLV